MAQVSLRARIGLVLGVTILCILVVTQPTFGAYYTVGGATGWTFNVDTWPNGKTFKAGDVLVFNYGSGVHNVVAVSKSEYDNCTSTTVERVHQSGKDRIKLNKGQTYFICTIPGHCQGGMKIAVNVD